MLDLICNPSDSAFSPPVAAAWCSRNGAASLARLAKYKELSAPEKLTITKEPSALCATFSGLWEGGEPSPELGAAEFIFLASLMRKAADPAIRPLGASVRGGFNDEDVAGYLGCRIEDGERCEIRFSKADMAKPFSTWSPRIWDNLSPVLESRLGKAQGTFSSGVVHALQSMLPAGECGIADAASRLCMSPRTLQRRLLDEGATFHKLLASTRLDLACRYLGGTTMSIGEAAFLLGYSETNSFQSAFASWTGMSPSSWRRCACGRA